MPNTLQMFNLTCLVENQTAQQLVNSFEELDCELQSFKSFSKLLKSSVLVATWVWCSLLDPLLESLLQSMPKRNI